MKEKSENENEETRTSFFGKLGKKAATKFGEIKVVVKKGIKSMFNGSISQEGEIVKIEDLTEKHDNSSNANERENSSTNIEGINYFNFLFIITIALIFFLIQNRRKSFRRQSGGG